MKNVLLIIFLVVCNFVQSQKKIQNFEIKEKVKSGTLTALVSIFPYHVANKTFKTNDQLNYKVLYGSVWVGIGVVFDLLSVSEFVKAYKISKKNKSNEN